MYDWFDLYSTTQCAVRLIDLQHCLQQSQYPDVTRPRLVDQMQGLAAKYDVFEAVSRHV